MPPEVQRLPGCLYSAAPWSNLSGSPICALEHLLTLRGTFDEVRLVLCQHGPLEDRARAAGVPVWCAPFEFRGLRRAGLLTFRWLSAIRGPWLRYAPCATNWTPGQFASRPAMQA